jgi:hypothetical protein
MIPKFSWNKKKFLENPKLLISPPHKTRKKLNLKGRKPKMKKNQIKKSKSKNCVW